MTARRTTFILVVVTLFYCYGIGWRGVTLLQDHRVDVKVLGVGVLMLPVVGIVVLVNEVKFGRATSRLAADHGPAPANEVDALPKRPSGRIDRKAADEFFELKAAEVEAAPADWRAWYRLSIAYGDAGDNARGRRAMRKAIALHDGSALDGSALDGSALDGRALDGRALDGGALDNSGLEDSASIAKRVSPLSGEPHANQPHL